MNSLFYYKHFTAKVLFIKNGYGEFISEHGRKICATYRTLDFPYMCVGDIVNLYVAVHVSHIIDDEIVGDRIYGCLITEEEARDNPQYLIN